MDNQTHSVAEVESKTFEVRFGGFEGLPAVKGQDRVDSPEFTCFGHQWCVRLWPGGDDISHVGKVSVYLCHASAGRIGVQATFVVKKSKTKVAAYRRMSAKTYKPRGDSWGSQNFVVRWGCKDFADRSTLIEALEDGALIIEVLMKQTGPSTLAAPFVPTNPFCQNALKKFLDEESADVVFEVTADHLGGERKTRKRAKTAPTTFHAHRFVLPKSGALAEACEASNDLTPISINGIEPSIFRHLLYYLYGGTVDDDVLKENAKDIIDAADKFGVVGLKLAAEAAHVSSTDITIDNAIDNLLYADAKNCALLKEAVMDFIVENGNESAELLSFDNVPSYLMKDLLTAMNIRSRDKKKGGGGEGGDELRTMRVSELRGKLAEKGLDVDGSREAMIAALEENS